MSFESFHVCYLILLNNETVLSLFFPVNVVQLKGNEPKQRNFLPIVGRGGEVSLKKYSITSQHADKS